MNVRVFTVFLLTGLLLFSVAAMVVLGTGLTRLRDSYGLHLAQIADQAAATVDAYVFRRITDALILARVPDVRATAAEGTSRPFDPAVVREIDREWTQKRAVPAAVAGLMTNRASAFLADVVARSPIYREILLTDRQGRLVAASNLTSDYYQADEDWWYESLGNGVHGRLTVSDVQWDDSARAYAVSIAVPVLDPSTETLAGILEVWADIREMGAVIENIRLGTTGEATLLRRNGSIVFSRRPLDSNAQFFAADLLREQLGILQQGQPRSQMYFAARAGDGSTRVVGVGLSQLGMSYPKLSWLVAVSESEDELYAPVRAQAVSLLLVLALMAVAVLTLALWFSMRLAAPPPEADLGLVDHPKARRMEEAA
jgi:hypothetical protein